MTLWWVAAAAASIPAIWWRGRYLLHMMQLAGYRADRYVRWMRRESGSLWERWMGILWLVWLAAGCLPGSGRWREAGWVMYALLAAWLAGKGAFVPAKKPLVWTPRAKRLFAVYGVVAVVAWCVSLLAGERGSLAIVTANLWAAPLWMTAASVLAAPVERRINDGFLRMAKEKLQKRSDLIVVGVTGSYGKTSTKFILGTLLAQKFNVLVTPDSYNTPMGVCRVINEQLKPEHEVFVVEMGARQPGDIRELTELARPTIGVLTAVGPTHLETFGSVEAVARTKYELIAGLPPAGLAVINVDNEYCRELADKTQHVKVEPYGLDTPGVRFAASDISVSEAGTTFLLEDRATGETVRCQTELLGRHQVLNILGAVTVARHLGLTMRQIAAGIRQLRPVPHRLQLIRSGGLYVIDDAFNANPAGTRVALEVLSGFSGRKVVVTPGMVELGGEEERYNREFGEQMARVCDYVILVGPERTRPIAEGLRSTGFPEDRLRVVENLEEATRVLQGLVGPGDVVLFENDLPDNYGR